MSERGTEDLLSRRDINQVHGISGVVADCGVLNNHCETKGNALPSRGQGEVELFVLQVGAAGHKGCK